MSGVVGRQTDDGPERDYLNASGAENWYSRLFARFYDPFMANIERKVLHKRRRKLLGDLNGNILEVGAGTGINFPFYAASAQVLAIEPSAQMLKRASARLPDAGNIALRHAGMGDPELNAEIEACSLDAVVCTLVLCTVPEPEKSLRDIYHWLKPGGSLKIIEHIRSEGKFKGKFQDMVNPVWKKFAEGCNLNRDTASMITAAGFVAVEVTPVNLGMAGIWGSYVKP